MKAREPRFAQALRAAMRGEVRENEPLGRYSTYRIGGPATVALPAGPEDVAQALRLAAEYGTGWFAIGLGSNILLPDEGLDVLVIRIGKGLDQVKRDAERWTLGAGLPGPLAARRTAEAGHFGLHKFVGVPGTVGGGVYMNAGCHGAEWGEFVESVVALDAGGEAQTIPRAEIPFRYRSSGLGDRIIVEATVRLRPEDPRRLTEEVAELFRWRSEGTPFNQPCCGSVFKNPAGPSWQQRDGPRTAGQLIEATGLKGYRIGGAQISPLHANYFVNTGAATAGDVLGLIEHARTAVRERFGVQLETEVKVVGRDGRYIMLSPSS